jgi:hypothetical protein
MGKARAQPIILLAILWIGGAIAVDVAYAAPPPNASASMARSFAAQRNSSQATQSRGAAAARLDLRIPAHPMEPDDKTLAFPSSNTHGQFGGIQDSTHQPSVATEATRERPPLEVMARRIHREGLPVARLWENKSALVHIGLNQRGKPGLWLVQKIH